MKNILLPFNLFTVFLLFVIFASSCFAIVSSCSTSQKVSSKSPTNQIEKKAKESKKQKKQIEKKSATEKSNLIYTGVKNVYIPRFVFIDGKKRVLNGFSIRALPYLFNLKIAITSIYIKEKKTDSDSILNSTYSVLARIVFLRNITAKQIQNNFKDSFKKVCAIQNCDKFEKSRKSFDELPKFSKYDVLEFEIFPEKTITKKNKKLLNTIDTPGFGKLMLKTWLGKVAIPKQRKDLLGL